MASRTWVAVSLMLFIWFAYIRWFAPLPPPPVAQQATPVSGEQKSGAPSTVENGTGTKIPTTTGEAVSSSSSGAVGVFAPIGSKTTYPVSTAKLSLEFSAEGGKISRAALPNFKESIGKNSPPIVLISNEQSPLSLATLFTEPQMAGFARESYQVEQTGNKIRFQRSENGVSVWKEYGATDQSNFIDVHYKITLPDSSRREWGSLLIPVGTNATQKYDAEAPLHSWETVAYQNDAVTRNTIEQLAKNDEISSQGLTSWLSFGNRYFATVVINNNQSQINPDVVYKKTDNFVGAYLKYPLVLKEGQNEIEFSYQFYIGPKEYTELSKVPGLKKLIDYGTFAFFAYPLLEILRFFHKFIHNYGVAIILLTLLVRALFYPLQAKSMKSMKAMQKLQPQIAALKEKYKDDSKKMNEEQMALFKAHKVNPAGGCLPMLVQLPVFIALYAVLGNSIELFQAPFFGWIHDLSTKDPFYVYPVLMGISMFVQQKMTPTAGMDPAQQKIMLIMPVMFSFMMINLPSGLTIYIFVSTILGIAQQMALKDKPTTVPQPA